MAEDLNAVSFHSSSKSVGDQAIQAYIDLDSFEIEAETAWLYEYL